MMYVLDSVLTGIICTDDSGGTHSEEQFDPSRNR